MYRRAPGETRHLWYVHGAYYDDPQPAIPTDTPEVYYLPRIKRHATLGGNLFTSQSAARSAALEYAKGPQP